MISVGAMAVATSAAWVPAAAEPEGQPPLLLPRDLWLTPEPFAHVCAANPEAVLELTPEGQLITMTPTGGETGTRNSLLMARLQIWALQRGGWNVFASSSGFRLGDGSVPNPDASLMRLERWEALFALMCMPWRRSPMGRCWSTLRGWGWRSIRKDVSHDGLAALRRQRARQQARMPGNKAGHVHSHRDPEHLNETRFGAFVTHQLLRQ